MNNDKLCSIKIHFSFIKNRISFAKKIFNICVKEAVSSLIKEKALHDDLEEIYIEAMDFKKTESLVTKLTNAII